MSTRDEAVHEAMRPLYAAIDDADKATEALHGALTKAVSALLAAAEARVADLETRIQAAERAITQALSMLQDECVARDLRAIDALCVLREHRARALVGDETPETGERA